MEPKLDVWIEYKKRFILDRGIVGIYIITYKKFLQLNNYDGGGLSKLTNHRSLVWFQYKIQVVLLKKWGRWVNV